ncbi:flavodoxin family protein [Corynebacterium amycolatum]
MLEGANDPALEGVDVKVVEALDATIDDLTSADAILLGTSANFGYISGALKHFFDTTFREAQEVTKGLPFSYWIRGGFDTTGAENAMKTITTGYKWELAAEPVVFVGSLDDDISDRLVNLGGTMAAQILG